MPIAITLVQIDMLPLTNSIAFQGSSSAGGRD